MSKEKKGFKATLNKMIFSILVLFVILIISIGGYLIFKQNAGISEIQITQVLEESSELTTAKLKITGMHKYKDDGIPIINKSNFIMIYKATVRIGIDLKDVDVKVDNEKNIVILTIPKARVIDAKVDNGDIEYLDEKFALFNVNPKEDSDKAKVEAEKMAIDEASKIGVLEFADDQAEKTIKGLLFGLVPDDYKFEIIRT